VAHTSAPHLAAHPRVGASGRALTHIEVRWRASSAALSAGLAMRGATKFTTVIG
jgi:hypothetical protein